MEDITNQLKDILAKRQEGKTGYVALIGRPNVGKSTFLNTVLHRHLAAVSAKPQTTRKHLLGIMTDQEAQILFLDTPGIHQSYIALDEAMDRSINRVLDDADLILCLVDPTRKPGAEDTLAIERVQKSKKPVMVVLNKTDIATSEQLTEAEEFYRQRFAEVPFLKMSALDEASCQPVLAKIKEALPEGPFLYDEDEITDVYEREIAQEFIRETLLEQLRQEVPHCTAVLIDQWKEQEEKIFVSATLYVERTGHKGIILGKGGERIRQIRVAAARKIAEFCGKKIDLSMFVKLHEDWRGSKHFLTELGLE